MGDDKRLPVTFALFAYNQEQFIREAVEGAFAQTYQPLQIILSDDCSSDRTFEIMQEMAASYKGPHAIVLKRNVENLGIGRHVNSVMRSARGDIVVAAAGDDISRKERVERLVEGLQSSTEPAYSIWSRAEYVDEVGEIVKRDFPGNPGGFTDKGIIRNMRPLIGATHAWRREIFDFFGPLMDGVVFEDNAISFRSYLLGDIKYCDEDLVSYRTHTGNITNFSKNTDILELYKAAAKRNRWALTGILQRKKDLAVAREKIAVPNRDHELLHREIERMERRTKRRLSAYENFPRISWSSMIYCPLDLELAKTVMRSIFCQLRKS